ncbi:MAG TPA: TlpA disulfide reductase family protein [Candidatus Limnocylindrales bacterium]|nr:TlpA disulfide reductase family protein [Candidatus Limnocylindrales bacterium]
MSDAPLADQRPTFTHKPEKHGLIGPFTGRQLALAAIVVVAVAVGLVIATTPLGSVNPPNPGDPRATPYILGPAPAQGLRPGDVPPELQLTAADGTKTPFTDLDGKPVSLADLEGKAVWINFFASWCPPCQSETPVLRDIAERYRDRGLEVVGISVQETNADDVRAYAERYQLGYTIGADLSGEIFRAYRLWGLPTQFFVGPDGVIRSVVLAPLSEAGAAAQVEAILPES